MNNNTLLILLVVGGGALIFWQMNKQQQPQAPALGTAVGQIGQGVGNLIGSFL